MPVEVTIPRLGWSMEEGRFAQWLKQDGELVKSGDLLFVLEGDKSTQEIECFDQGTLMLSSSSPRPGDTVKVGQVIAHLLAAGEKLPGSRAADELPADKSPPGDLDDGKLASGTRLAAPLSETARQPHTSRPTVAPPAGPAMRRLARQQQVRLPLAVAAGPAERVLVQGMQAANTISTAPPGQAKASPRARKRAADLGVDWTTVSGTGAGGRVRERDVLAAAESPPASSLLAGDAGQFHPWSEIRRTIAKRMVDSHRNAAPATLTTTADATNLVNLRDQFKAAGEPLLPSYSDFLARLTAVALASHPHLNAWCGEAGLTTFAHVHLGIAVDTPAGLLVPVLRHVDQLNLRGITAQTRELLTRARQGRLQPAEMHGGTFTLTNLGSYGIDGFTPILNAPQAAILGIGRIRKTATVVENQCVPRDTLCLSLTFDHRAVDGAPAAHFLQSLVTLLEHPAPHLMEGAT